MKMDTTEYLLTSSEETQQYSACLWDYKTSNALKYYRNGGVVQRKCLGILGQDYILASEPEKPLLHVWLLNGHEVSRDVRLILPEPASCMAICPANIYLAVGIRYKLYIWHISSGKLLAVQDKSFRTLTCMKFSSDGDFLLVGAEDGMLYAYNFGDLLGTSNSHSQSSVREPAYVKHDHMEQITDIHVGQFAGKARFATVSTDHTCRVYTLKKGTQQLNLVFTEKLTSVLFDGPCWELFAGTESGTINQYTLTDPPKTPSHHFTEESGTVLKEHQKKIVCMALNQTDTILASGSEDNFVCLWNVKDRIFLKKLDLKGAVTNVAFVGAFENFLAEKFQPQTVLKSLGRCLDMTPLRVFEMQTDSDDTDSDDDEGLSAAGNTIDILLDENRQLRAMMEQLYTTALTMAKNKSARNTDT